MKSDADRHEESLILNRVHMLYRSRFTRLSQYPEAMTLLLSLFLLSGEMVDLPLNFSKGKDKRFPRRDMSWDPTTSPVGEAA